MSAGGEPSQVGRQIGQQLRKLLQTSPGVHSELAARVGVGVTDLLALDHITSASGPMGVGELSRLLGIRSASATVLVDRLVATGHLERGPHPTDRRRTSLNATSTAYDDVRMALAPLIGDIGRITSALSADQAEVVLRFLEEITDALEKFGAGRTCVPAGRGQAGDTSEPERAEPAGGHPAGSAAVARDGVEPPT